MNATQNMYARILRAVGAGTLGQIINVVGRLLLVPLFLSAWGASTYGEWLLLSSLAAWLTLGDMGGQVYFVNRLTAQWSSGQKDEFAATWGTASTIFLTLPLALFLLFAGIASVLPLADWIGVQKTPGSVVTPTLILLALQIALSLPQGLLVGLYRAIGKQATSTMLGNAIVAMQLGLSAGTLIMGGGMLELATVQVAPIAIVIAYAYWDLSQRMPSLQLVAVQNFDAGMARSSLSPSIHFFGIQMAQVLLAQGSLLAVGRTLGAVEAAVFSTLRTIANLIHQLLGLLSHAAWPEYTRLDVAGQYVQLRTLLLRVLRVTLISLAWIVLGLEFAGQTLFDLWLQERLPYDEEVMRLLMFYSAVTVIWLTPGNLLMATNNHLTLARAQLAIAAVGVVGCSVGVSSFGVEGAVLGLLLCEALPMVGLVMQLSKRTGWYPGARQIAIEGSLVGAVLAMAPWPALGTAGCLVLTLRLGLQAESSK